MEGERHDGNAELGGDASRTAGKIIKEGGCPPQDEPAAASLGAAHSGAVQPKVVGER